MKDSRAYVAKLLATFALCFFGAGAIVTNTFTDGALGLIGIAVANAAVLTIMINATGHVSGTHINLAITIGMIATKRIELGRGIGYIVSQLIGATLAGFALRAIFAPSVWAATHLGTPALSPKVPFAQGVLVEAILTFFLMFTIYATAVDKRAPKSIYGFAIGTVLLFAILMGGPLTGASMNPARTFGPGLAAGFFEDHLVYWIGPLIGSLAAAFLYNHFFMSGKESAFRPSQYEAI